MMDRPRFRRKHQSATGKIANDDSFAPVPPLESRAERLARRRAEEVEADEQARAEAARLRAEAEEQARAEEARRRAEAEDKARAEEARRKAAAEEQARAEEARRKAAAEEQARAEEARRKAAAEEKARVEEARRRAAAEEKARAEEARRKAAAEEKARAEEARRRAEAEEKARAEEARRRAAAEEQARAEEARRRAAAEEKARAEEARRKAEAVEQARAEEARRKAAAEEQARAEEARRKAEAEEQARRKAEAEEQARAEEARRRRELAARREQAEERARKARAAADRLEAEARRAAEEEAEALGEARPRSTPPLTLSDPIRPKATPARPAATPAPIAPARPVRPAKPEATPDTAWAALGEITVDEGHLHRNRIITARRDDPAHTAFDVLRTRLLQALSEHGWKRVAITSPGQGCGKTFTAANLAISLSRQENCRTLLLDCDLRRPTLHRVMGIDRPGSVGDMLRGRISPEDHLKRMGRNPVQAGRNIAFGFNEVVEPYASELLQDPRTAETLKRIETGFGADVLLFDLPPALFYDDVIAFRPQFDGVLLVIGGGLTTEKEIKEVERRLGEDTPLLGMVLNKAEGTEIDRYTY